MAQPVTDGKGKATGTVRDHYTAMVGRGRTEYAEKLQGPPFPAGFAYLWEAYQDLSEGRTPGGMGPSRLTWTDVQAWQTVTGARLTGWEVQTIFAMDAALTTAMTAEA